jgi:H+/Cl- antiporter ClcA
VIDKLRHRLASADALPQLALLGICSGLFSGAVIILFRLVVETAQAGFLPGANPENYEGLMVGGRFLLALAGGLTVGLIFHFLAKGATHVGVVHVLERLAYHQGNLPVKNFVMQFLGASLSIISGHSVGREGPGVHLGAGGGSFISQFLQLPNNCTRTLVACGVAASIGASFNTPIAGVFFALEVITAEYTVAGFIPITLAAVSATLLTRGVFGDQPAYSIPTLQGVSLGELPVLILIGIAAGSIAALFISLVKWVTEHSKHIPLWQRMTLAGAVVGLCAIPAPEVMGIGYDTVNQTLLGELGLGVLGTVLVLKLLATTVGVGLGLPGGLIGPTLVIGSTLGGAVGLAVTLFYSQAPGFNGFYALMGMGAMMGATLQAPMAALMALLELTMNTHLILPGMVVVTIAVIICRDAYGKESVFIMMLKIRGLDYQHSPIAQSLRRVGVASVMSRSFIRAAQKIRRGEVQKLLAKEPEWIIVENNRYPLAIMPTAALVQFVNMNQADEIDLMEIPGRRSDAVALSIRATLQQALERMEEHKVDVVYIGQTDSQRSTNVYGVVTRQSVDTHYQLK